MRKVLESLHSYESQRACRGLPTSEPTVDLEDGDSVLDFTYDYLKAHSRPPSDDEVRKVTATIALHKGPRAVLQTTLEAFLVSLVR